MLVYTNEIFAETLIHTCESMTNLDHLAPRFQTEEKLNELLTDGQQAMVSLFKEILPKHDLDRDQLELTELDHIWAALFPTLKIDLINLIHLPEQKATMSIWTLNYEAENYSNSRILLSSSCDQNGQPGGGQHLRGHP